MRGRIEAALAGAAGWRVLGAGRASGRGGGVPCLDRLGQLHPAGLLQLPARRWPQRRAAAADEGNGARHSPRIRRRCPVPELQQPAARDPRARTRAAASAHRHQGQHPQHGTSRYLPRLHRGQAVRAGRQRDRRAPLPRPADLDRLQHEPAADSHARPQGRTDGRPGGVPACAAMPARPSCTSSRPIRATSCSRPPRTSCSTSRWASCTWRTGRGCGCSCGATPSPASSRCIVFVPRDRYNTAMRERMEALLREAVGRHESEFQAQLSESKLARLLFTLRTPHGLPDDWTRPSSSGGWSRCRASWPDRLRDALVEPWARSTATGCSTSTARAFPASYKERVDARAAVPDIASIDRLARDGAGDLAMTPLSAAGGPGRAAAFQADPARPAGPAVGRSAGAREHGPEGAERGAQRDRRRRRAAATRCTISACGRSSARPVEVEAVREHFQDLFSGVWTGRLENDGFNRLVLAAGLSPRQIVILRAYCQLHPADRHAVQPSLYRADAGRRTPSIAHDLAALFDARFDPRAAGDRDGAAGRAGGDASSSSSTRSRASTRTGSCVATSSCCKATLRTNALQTDAAGEPKDYVSYKFDPSRVPGLPVPRPAFEIFVYAPLCRGRAPARRQGRPRRPALVRPARGLPHRDPGPDEGADGQERRHRAGGREGRLRRQAAAAGLGPGGASWRRACAATRTFLRGLLDITDNQASRRHRPAARRGPLRRRRPLSRRRGRQGHRHLLRLSPTASAGTTASGSTTPSPPAARPATTTRRWASPPRVPGNRSSATSASSGSTPRPSPSRSSASATCRATCSATACCCRSRSGSWPPSITATSSSTPIPTRHARSPSGSACSTCRARAGTTTTER